MEMKIKAVRLYFSLVRVTRINKTINNKCWRVCGEKETSFTVGEIADLFSHSVNQRGEFLKTKNKSII